MPKDMPSLLTQGVRDARNQENALIRSTAQEYRDSYKIVESELAILHATIAGSDNPQLEAAKYGRLTSMLDTYQKEYQRLTGKTISSTGLQSANNFIGASQRVNWAAEQELRIGVSFGVVPIDAVRASLYSEQSGRNYIVTFKDNARTRIQTTRAAITRMIATGQSWQRTAEELKDQFERGYSDAARVIRTETARNYTQGTLNGFARAEDVGINIVKTWLATLDDVTRDTHAALDGTDADEDGLFWIGSDSAEGPGLFADPAEVVNCRCAVIARIGGISPAFRRDNMDKEADPISFTTWTDWAESKGWSEETGWPKAKDAL